MKITWDDAKRRANLDKHGMDLSEVTPSIFDSGIVQIARGGRFKVIGYVKSRAVAMIIKPSGSEAIAVISLRPASTKERTLL